MLGFYVAGLSNAGTQDPTLRMSAADLPHGLHTLAVLLCQAGNPRYLLSCCAGALVHL
jgi:hypothetical protein